MGHGACPRADASNGRAPEILRGGDPRIVPTGHLVYALGNALFAIPFDVERLEVSGGPIPVIEGVQRGIRGSTGQGGSANYDVSSNGTLVYVPDLAADAPGVPRRLLAVDLSGNAVPLIEDERDFWRPRISPDGSRVAVEVRRPNSSSQLWIVDLERRMLNPVGAGESGYARRAGEDEGVGRGLDPKVRGDALRLLVIDANRVLYWRLTLGVVWHPSHGRQAGPNRRK